MKKILFLITAICLFAACDKKDSEQGALPVGTAVSITSAEFSPIGSEVDFAVSADSEWSIVAPAWVSLSKTSGKSGTTEITMHVELNDERVNRSGMVTITAADRSFSETIEVSQATPYLNVDRWTIPYTWDYCQTFGNIAEEIHVESNVDWVIEEVSYTMAEAAAVNRYAMTVPPIFTEELADVLNRWLMVSQMEGMNDAVLTFIPATYNISDAPYELQLRLYGPLRDGFGRQVSSDKQYEHFFNFTQANLRFLIDIVDSDDDQTRRFAACNNSDVAVSVNSELNWSVQSKPDWVTVTPDTGTGSTMLSQSNVNINGANPTTEERSGEIIFVPESGTDPLPERVITVTQAPYVFDLGFDSELHSNFDDVERSCDVYSSGAWQVDPASVPEWVSMVVSSGVGIEYGAESAAFSYRIPEQNLELEDREVHLRVQSVEAGNTMEHDFLIRQEKFIFDAAFEEILTMSTEFHSGTIYSTGDWEISSVTYEGSPVQDWLEFQTTSGSGEMSINYRATSINTSEEDRVAQVTIKSMTHERAGRQLEKTFVIKQRKYTFNLLPNSGTTFSDVAYWTQSHTVTLDASVNWTVEAPEWVTASKYSGAGNETLTFTMQTNPTGNSRTGQIKITGSRNDTFVYNVTQSAYLFTVDAETTYQMPVEPATFTIGVLSSGPWYISQGEGDNTFSPDRGDGRDENATVTVSTNWNPDLTERTMRISVYDEATSQSSMFTIVQAPFLFDSDPESFDYPTLDPSQSSFDVVCSSDWTLMNVPSWITPSQRSGSGNATLTITPSNNIDILPRSETFWVQSSVGGHQKMITVSQDAYEFDASSVSFSYEALETTTNRVDVTSTGPWIVDGVPTWITLSKSSGETHDSFTLTPTRNTASTSRSVTFNVRATLNSTLRKQVTVTQAAYNFSSNVTSIELNAFANATGAFTLTSTGSWTASSNQSWLTLDKTSGTGNATINVTTTSVNPTEAGRTATVTLTSTDDSSRTVTITVRQQGYNFSANTTSLTLNATAGSYSDFTLTSTGSWTASSSQTWLTLDKTSGTGSTTIRATVSTVNPTNADRSAQITLTSTDDPNRKVTITVTQSGYQFAVGATTLSVGNAANSTGQIALTSTGGWTASSNQAWLTVSPASGTGNATVTATATAANTATSTRTATVTFTSTDDSNRTATVTVTQAAAPTQN